MRLSMGLRDGFRVDRQCSTLPEGVREVSSFRRVGGNMLVTLSRTLAAAVICDASDI